MSWYHRKWLHNHVSIVKVEMNPYEYNEYLRWQIRRSRNPFPRWIRKAQDRIWSFENRIKWAHRRWQRRRK